MNINELAEKEKEFKEKLGINDFFLIKKLGIDE
jgi:hypothetical protein